MILVLAVLEKSKLMEQISERRYGKCHLDQMLQRTAEMFAHKPKKSVRNKKKKRIRRSVALASNRCRRRRRRRRRRPLRRRRKVGKDSLT